MITIKVENNLEEILKYLEFLGYKWHSINTPPTEICFITKKEAKVIYVHDNRTITWGWSIILPVTSFEEFKESMNRDKIQAGYTIVLQNSTQYTVVETPNGKFLAPKGSCRAMISLEEISNVNLTPKEGYSPIVEIKDVFEDTIWTKPIEMTVSEIEVALKLTPGTLRIKK